MIDTLGFEGSDEILECFFISYIDTFGLERQIGRFLRVVNPDYGITSFHLGPGQKSADESARAGYQYLVWRVRHCLALFRKGRLDPLAPEGEEIGKGLLEGDLRLPAGFLTEPGRVTYQELDVRWTHPLRILVYLYIHL